MCWVGNDVKIIAKEDYSVFKVVLKTSFCDRYKSLYQGFSYQLGCTYRSEIIKRIGITSHNSDIYIYEGLHSYNKSVHIDKSKTYLEIYAYYSLTGEGLLDYISLPSSHVFYKLECIIPKGSEYYQNSKGEIVSNCLKIIEAKRI